MKCKNLVWASCKSLYSCGTPNLSQYSLESVNVLTDPVPLWSLQCGLAHVPLVTLVTRLGEDRSRRQGVARHGVHVQRSHLGAVHVVVECHTLAGCRVGVGTDQPCLVSGPTGCTRLYVHVRSCNTQRVLLYMACKSWALFPWIIFWKLNSYVTLALRQVQDYILFTVSIFIITNKHLIWIHISWHENAEKNSITV